MLYGCSEEIREQVIDDLSSCDHKLYHPLTLPALFAEIERDRHFDLVNPMVRKLMQRARSIANAQYSSGDSRSKQPAGVIQEPENYMQQWFEITYLKNGLQSWRHELQKMVKHCDDLTRANFHASQRSPASTESTPVNTTFSTDAFDSTESTDETKMDEIEQLKISGYRIRQRLLDIQAEYDDKVRECGMIIDGMVLAAQLVSAKLCTLSVSPSLLTIGCRNGTTLDKVTRRRIWTYQTPTSRSQGQLERMDSKCAQLPC